MLTARLILAGTLMICVVEASDPLWAKTANRAELREVAGALIQSSNTFQDLAQDIKSTDNKLEHDEASDLSRVAHDTAEQVDLVWSLLELSDKMETHGDELLMRGFTRLLAQHYIRFIELSLKEINLVPAHTERPGIAQEIGSLRNRAQRALALLEVVAK